MAGSRFKRQTSATRMLARLRAKTLTTSSIRPPSVLSLVQFNSRKIPHDNNVNGTLNIFLAARDAKVKRVVFASSSSVFGDHPALPKVEENIGRMLSPYALSKHMTELYADIVHRCYGLETVGLRYFNVFGRRQDPNGPYAAVIPKWLELLINRKRCTIYGDGETSRDFCYVDNAVQANLLAATSTGPVVNEIFNVGCGTQTTLKQLLNAICEYLIALGIPDVQTEPNFQREREGDVRHSLASIEKLQSATGFQPTHDIHEGLRETVRWFAQKHR